MEAEHDKSLLTSEAIAAAMELAKAADAPLSDEEALLWARFERWCETEGQRALPADPQTAARYLSQLEEPERVTATDVIAVVHERRHLPVARPAGF